MLIGVDVTPKQIGPALDWAAGLIGAQVDNLVRRYARHEISNPLLGDHFRKNYDLEFALAEARKYRKQTGRLPKGQDYHAVYGFLVAARRIHSRLPPSARNPFEGRLRYALNSDQGARPFAYEIGVAVHLMSKGWDVEFIDYAGVGQFDFLASRGGIEIEVECKTTSGDTGRKIHRRELNRLADLILPATAQLVDGGGNHLLRITLPDRLEKSDEAVCSVASAVIEAAAKRREVTAASAHVAYSVDHSGRWPPLDGGRTMLNFFERRFGIKNAPMFFHGRPGAGIVAVAIASAKADKVIRAISDEAKSAAKQCSGTRPAFVALHLVDELNDAELEAMLSTQNGMHAIARETFGSGKRSHVDSIAFTFPQSMMSDGAGAKWLSGRVLRLDNPQPRFECPELRTIFR